jgi:UDP-N-acetylmuramoyl-tripeptide--D-alanyl-D-alanine ligase
MRASSWPEPVPVRRFDPPAVDSRAWVRWSRALLVVAVQGLARVVVAVRRPVIVTVTGSHGKTTTREHVAAVLRCRWPDLRVTPYNMNSDIGSSMVVLGGARGPAWDVPRKALVGLLRSLAPWRPYPSALVLEVTAKNPGDLQRLTRWLRPHIAVLTNVRDAHIGNYPSAEALAGEKCWPLRRLRPGGVAVLNAEDPLTARLLLLLGERARTFGGPDGDVRAEDVRTWDGVTRATVAVGEQRFDVAVPLWAPHQIGGLLAAVAVGVACGVEPVRALEAVGDLGSLPGRGRVLRTGAGAVVVDESGNASPSAMRAALEALRDTLPPPHVAIVSGMYEIGDDHVAEHRATGAAMAPWLDRLIAVGTSAQFLAEGAIAAGLPPERITYARDAAHGAELAREIQGPASVLIKGTIYLHLIVTELTGDLSWPSHRRRGRLPTS